MFADCGVANVKAGFPLANIFARSDFFPLSLSFRLKPSETNKVETKEKSRFVRKNSLAINISSPVKYKYDQLRQIQTLYTITHVMRKVL